MVGYTDEAKDYWEDSIKQDKRFSSVSVRSLPELINQKRKEKLYPVIRNLIQDEFSDLNGRKILYLSHIKYIREHLKSHPETVLNKKDLCLVQ